MAAKKKTTSPRGQRRRTQASTREEASPPHTVASFIALVMRDRELQKELLLGEPNYVMKSHGLTEEQIDVVNGLREHIRFMVAETVQRKGSKAASAPVPWPWPWPWPWPSSSHERAEAPVPWPWPWPWG